MWKHVQGLTVALVLRDAFTNRYVKLAPYGGDIRVIPFGVLTMPKTLTKNVYTFKELLEAAKEPESEVNNAAVEKARAWLQEGQTDHSWWDYTYEMWKQALEQVGFIGADIHFSGFWSPGDGASFEADLDFEKLIAFLSKPIRPINRVGVKNGEEQFLNYVVHKLGSKTTDKRFADLRCVVDQLRGRVNRHCHQYSHERTCGVSIERNGSDDDEIVESLTKICLDDLVQEFEEAVEELRLELCKVIYQQLEEEHEYLTSDESLIEASEANDYAFDEDGEYEPS